MRVVIENLGTIGLTFTRFFGTNKIYIYIATRRFLRGSIKKYAKVNIFYHCLVLLLYYAKKNSEQLFKL